MWRSYKARRFAAYLTNPPSRLLDDSGGRGAPVLYCGAARPWHRRLTRVEADKARQCSRYGRTRRSALCSLTSGVRRLPHPHVSRMTPSIRPAAAGDAGALALVAQATFLETFAGVLEGHDVVAHSRAGVLRARGAPSSGGAALPGRRPHVRRPGARNGALMAQCAPANEALQLVPAGRTTPEALNNEDAEWRRR